MILIDLGNTNAKIYFEDKMKKIATNDIFEYLDTTSSPVLLCSVVPKLTEVIASRYPNVQIIEKEDYNTMFDNQGQLDSKGADRIIAAFAAVKLYGPKVVVVDIGTCVTVDVVNERKYLSGLIYPGFLMLENILDEKVSQLPKPKAGSSSIATANQIYFANIYGFIGSIDKMIEMSMPDTDIGYKLVVTGGSVLKLNEEYGVDILDHLKKYKPIDCRNLIKLGMEYYIKEKHSN